MSDEGFFIDHVIYGVVDVDAAADRLRHEFGLGSVPGGLHLGGTTNRIVPLGVPVYLELLGIGDPSLADGAWLQAALDGRDRPLWWVLGCTDLEETARRRGLHVQHGTMAMADGTQLGFRTAGMPRYPLPFFLEYDVSHDERTAAMKRHSTAADHECAPGGFTFVEVADPPPVIDGWLGDHDLDVRFCPTQGSGIRSAGIATDRGEIVIS